MTTADPRRFADLDWGRGNADKILARGISTDDCAEVLRNDPQVLRNKNTRAAEYRIIGRTDAGRRLRLNVIWSDERERLLRVVGAWWL